MVGPGPRSHLVRSTVRLLDLVAAWLKRGGARPRCEQKARWWDRIAVRSPVPLLEKRGPALPSVACYLAERQPVAIAEAEDGAGE